MKYSMRIKNNMDYNNEDNKDNECNYYRMMEVMEGWNTWDKRMRMKENEMHTFF